MMLLSLLYLTATVVVVIADQQIEVDEETFARYGAGFPSITGTGTEFRKVNEVTLSNGEKRVKYIQYHDGVRVDNTGVVSSITSKGGPPAHVTGSMYELEGSMSLLHPDTIDSEEAVTKAKEFYRPKLDSKVYEFENEEVELKIVPAYGRVYEVNFFIALPDNPVRPYILVDAVSGQVREWWEGLDSGRRKPTPATKPDNAGSGPGGNKRTGAYKYEYGGKYGTFYITKKARNMCAMENDEVKTIDLEHKSGSNLPTTAYMYPCGEHNENQFKKINEAFSPLNDAHYFGKVLFDMYRAWAGVDPLKFKLIIRVHYGNAYENAFWNGKELTFGDGGNTFYPLVDVNVVAHEAAHGFTGQNSQLVYSEMSGGMNEAYSDIAGEAAEAYMKEKSGKPVDWMVGADIYKASGKAMRYFATPEKNGKSIGHVYQYYAKMDVHYSSGIFNKAFYLMATSQGWDVKKGFQVFTLANSLYWTPRSTFDQGACGVLKATRDLGYSEKVVRSAFNTVGVVTSTCKMPNEL